MITRGQIADKIVELIQKDVLSKLRETEGKNRSPRIDFFNWRVGAALGSPYCASGAWSAIQDACDALGLKNPVPATAWSQAFRISTFTPKRYIRAVSALGQKGDVGVYKVDGDDDRGHLVTVSEDQKSHPYFSTLEYNTDGSGSRDGDGCYGMVRSTIGETSDKFFMCFTDVPQWILDRNP